MIRFDDLVDYNLEHEQAVLGAVLLDPDAIDEVTDLLKPETFFLDAHRTVAAAMFRMRAGQKPIDPLTVQAEVGKTVEPGVVFGLARGVGTSANIRFYAESMRELYLRRELRQLAESVIAAGASEKGSALLQRLGNAVNGIETTNAKPVRLLGELVLDRFMELQRQMETQTAPDDLVPTGYTALDVQLGGGMKLGELYVIAARPGVGKTAFMRGLYQHMSPARPVGVFQLEDYADALANREIMARARIPSHKMRDGRIWTVEDLNRVNNAFDKPVDPIYIDDRHQRTVLDIASSMRQMKKKYGCTIFAVDNLTEIVLPEGESRDDQKIGRVCRIYRDTAKALGAIPILLVHLNRDASKKDRPPQLSDLKNSGDIEEVAHVVMMLSRDEHEAPEDFVVDFVKHRNGPPGKVHLKWNHQFMSVENKS